MNDVVSLRRDVDDVGIVHEQKAEAFIDVVVYVHDVIVGLHRDAEYNVIVRLRRDVDDDVIVVHRKRQLTTSRCIAAMNHAYRKEHYTVSLGTSTSLLTVLGTSSLRNFFQCIQCSKRFSNRAQGSMASTSTKPTALPPQGAECEDLRRWFSHPRHGRLRWLPSADTEEALHGHDRPSRRLLTQRQRIHQDHGDDNGDSDNDIVAGSVDDADIDCYCTASTRNMCRVVPLL
jgi:hypothetical protein